MSATCQRIVLASRPTGGVAKSCAPPQKLDATTIGGTVAGVLGRPGVTARFGLPQGRGLGGQLVEPA